MPIPSYLKLRPILPAAIIASSLNACSFVELHPGAQNIIFANDESCELIDNFKAKVQTDNAYISRSEKAIREELQIVAQNEAFKKNANAIWPNSEVIEGTQSFKLLKCSR